MTRFTRLFATLLLGLLAIAAFAQPKHLSSWSFRVLNPDVRAGESTQILFDGVIEKDWYIYGPQIKGYWRHTNAVLADTNTAPITVEGDDIWPEATMYKVADEQGNPDSADVAIYKEAVTFAVPVKIDESATPGEYVITFDLTAQACSTVNGLCDPGMTKPVEIPITIQPGEARAEHISTVNVIPEQPAGYHEPEAGTSYTEWAAASSGTPETAPPASGDKPTDTTTESINKAKEAGVLPFFLLSIGAGFLALLTPCVWPMIPVTVSYFSKQSTDGDKKKGLKLASAYCLGIIGTFVGLGLVSAPLFGAAGAQGFAANKWVNIFLGVLFVVLALNLFGYFEIAIPTKFVNKIQGKARNGGFIAPILLGFVFSLTTFTCTVPFVGTILVSATQGDYLFPIVGMFGFSLAFAIPFFFLALAPGAVSKLPKSGTWLNIVKGTMGFIELAAGLKFISNAELAFSAGFLTYPVYMAIWVLIFAATALFLFGIVVVPNSQDSKVGVGRKVAGVAMVGFCFYLLVAVNKPSILGSGIAFTPPIPYPGTQVAHASGLEWNHTYEATLAKAKEENKPMFLNFTGVTCANCRVMENRFHNREEYIEALKPYVLGELYTDRSDNPDDVAHAALREKLVNTSSNPSYVIVNPDGTVIDFYLGAALSPEAEEEFLGKLKAGAQTGASSVASK